MTGREPGVPKPGLPKPGEPKLDAADPGAPKPGSFELGASPDGAARPALPGTLHPAKIENAEQRRQRLGAELRANLVKRKVQARARAQTDAAQADAAQADARTEEP